MQLAWPRSVRVATTIVALVAALGVGGWWFGWRNQEPQSESEVADAAPSLPPTAPAEPAGSEAIRLRRDSWQAAGIEIAPVERGTFAQTIELTGKIALNEDRVAHIFPLVEGRVEEVKIHLGDKVRKGDLLVVVQSKEVGQAKLQLFADRLQRDFALTKDRWSQTVTANAQAMIKLMRDEAPLTEIEQQLTNRPMGEYREKLMSAYIDHYKSRQHLDRLIPLSQDGAIAGKQMLEAQADANGARATLQSLLEQLQQDAEQAAAISAQAAKELQTRVAVGETNLKILGFTDDDLKNIDPLRQGEGVSHYPIQAPFDGTVISKDVVLLERVDPASQILSIANLETVWVATDIYEEHLPLLKQLGEQVIHLRSSAWPGRKFDARIFYTGDEVRETSRTVSMRALADNRLGLLKPGMFVNVEFPSLARAEVLQLPLSAVQEHAGKSFVFVHVGEDAFERRDVTLGRRNERAVEIQAGLRGDEQVVTGGGFALKSQMLADLLSE